jgi:hypothetical protein
MVNLTASRSPQASTLPPQVMMLQMANAYRTSQAIHVAAKLGIADHLSNGAQSIQDLATATQTQPQALYRLLRALASMGIFAETDSGEFELTPRATLLQSTVPNSLRDYAIVINEPWHWQMWGDILHTVETGLPAFDHGQGMAFSEYYHQNPAIAATFDRAMVNLLENIDANILTSYDFSTCQTVVEIGIPGSGGNLMANVLKANPNLQGIIVLESGISATGDVLRNYKDRCQLLMNDPLSSMPGGDLYIIKNYIHDMDDHHAKIILNNCRQAMMSNAKVLIVEMLVPPLNEAALSKIVDVEALLMTSGGYERTEAQYRSLLESVGLTVTQVISTRSPFSLIEAQIQS